MYLPVPPPARGLKRVWSDGQVLQFDLRGEVNGGVRDPLLRPVGDNPEDGLQEIEPSNEVALLAGDAKTRNVREQADHTTGSMKLTLKFPHEPRSLGESLRSEGFAKNLRRF